MAQKRAHLVELRGDLRLGGQIRREIGLVVGEQIAALAGFGIVEQAAQFDDRGALQPRLRDGVRICAGFPDEPKRGGDNREEGRKCNDDGDDGGLNKRKLSKREWNSQAGRPNSSQAMCRRIAAGVKICERRLLWRVRAGIGEICGGDKICCG